MRLAVKARDIRPQRAGVGLRVPVAALPGFTRDHHHRDLGAAPHGIVHDVRRGFSHSPTAGMARRPAWTAGITVRVAAAPANAGTACRRKDWRTSTRGRRRRSGAPLYGRPVDRGPSPRLRPGRSGHLDARVQRNVRAAAAASAGREQIATVRHPIGRAMPIGDPVRRAATGQYAPAGSVMDDDRLRHAGEWLNASATPSACNARMPLGPIWMPAPGGANSAAAPVRWTACRAWPAPG